LNKVQPGSYQKHMDAVGSPLPKSKKRSSVKVVIVG
jgi:hypothetical protein